MGKKPQILNSMPVVIHDPEVGRIDRFVNWRVVESSNVERVGWDTDPTWQGMYVQFRGGSRYFYPGVSRQRAVAAAYSDSVGSYINEKVKGHFDYVKIG